MISRYNSSHRAAPSEPDDDGVSLDRDRADRLQRGKHRMHRTISGGGLALMLVLSACGSSGSDGAKGDAEGDQTAQAPAGDEAADSPAASTGGTGTGTIEIGDLEHELTVTRCMDMFGAIGGSAVSVSEPDNIEVTFEFSPENWSERDSSEGWTEDGTLRIDSEDPYLQWEAGPSSFEQYNLPAGVSAQDFSITAYDISDDGQSVTGEAQFGELNGLLAGTNTDVTTGTFSFSCPPKG